MNDGGRHILVIKLGALGDFIQALGPMAAIRAYHPSDRITLLTTPFYESLARASGYFDDILIDQRPKWLDLAGWISLRRTFKDGQFYRVYDLQNNDRTAFYLRLFSPKPEWVGAAPGASIRNNSPERTAGRAFDGHVQTLALAGIRNVTLDRLEWMQSTVDFEDIDPPYILIVPGSAANRPEKRWPALQYAALCKELVTKGYLPVLIGSEAESETLDEIKRAVPECLNLMGRTSLFDLPSLARNAAGAIGNDTGPMHLIAPTGCKSIVLFSHSSNPKRHAPLGRDVITLQKNILADLKMEDVLRVFERQQAGS